MACELEPPCAAPSRSGLHSRAAREAAARLLALCALVAGCSRGLAPPESIASNVPDTAYAVVAGVGVRAKTGWLGEPGVEEFVTPVHVEIDNGGPAPLRIRYSGISLESAGGQIFRALPPFDVRRVIRAKLERISPRFRHRDAAVAPYLGPIYEGVEVEPPAAQLEYPFDYAELYDRWHEGPLRPTRYMQEVALPEARVRPRGELSGFVYFERVPASEVGATLKLELVNADSGQNLGVAKISLMIH
jgi:hypothetical protein